MRQISVLLLYSLLLSCSAVVKKDFLSGLKVTHSGLAFEQAYMGSGGRPLRMDRLKTGQKVALQLTGVKGFELIDDMAYSGATIEVIDKTGAGAMEPAGFCASYGKTGVKPTDAGYLSTALTIGSPFR
ncbi:hypothetical protein LAG90_18245 [Marinilongibacter aquaticus]|uniref:hypothetical protein n=1 Tax=Marinilongibacter aquaticus TaxID=2975157 RepID=UPI0021BD4DC2|nr:hypothetical protein [Marinilongibacter aquaticus]UBM58744.1 hypothetical protein LAG90_18245 [Marinilongibacter aquaticus]